MYSLIKKHIFEPSNKFIIFALDCTISNVPIGEQKRSKRTNTTLSINSVFVATRDYDWVKNVIIFSQSVRLLKNMDKLLEIYKGIDHPTSRGR